MEEGWKDTECGKCAGQDASQIKVATCDVFGLTCYIYRTCSDPEVDASDDKKLDADMYENTKEEDESDEDSYLGSIAKDNVSLLSI